MVGYGFITALRLLLVLAIAAALVLTAGSHAVAATDECPSGWIALTFDDGPTLGRSETVLEVLDRTGTPATFFSIGSRVARNPELAIAMARHGHVMANHTWEHLDLTTLSIDDVLSSVRRTDTAYRSIGVEPLRLVRPPFLRTTRAINDALGEAGFVTVLETVNSKDWREITPDQIAGRVVSATVDGSVIGLHDGHDRYQETADATEMIIERLAKDGFCFGVLDGNGDVIPPRVGTGTSLSLSPVEIDEMVWIKYLMKE